MGGEDQKAARSAQLLAVAAVMSSQSGREFMHRCLMQAHVFVSVFDEDVVKHAFNAGRRESGLFMERELKAAAPDQYWLMMKENDHG